MSSSETFNFDNMEIAINSISDISKNIEEVFDSIYKIQEEFKKYHGGTYFETKFMTKSSMDSYINEIEANKKWLKDYFDKLKDVEKAIGNKSAGLGDHVSTVDTINESKFSKKSFGNSAIKDTSGVKQNDSIKEEKVLAKQTTSSKPVNDQGSVKQEDYIDESKNVTKTASISSVNLGTIKEMNSNLTPKLLIDTASDYKKRIVKEGWHYGVNHLIANDIEKSTSNNAKETCCATYVASVLYESGAFTAEELNKNVSSKSHNPNLYGYNHPEQLAALCENHGWTRINSYAEVQPGDIVFYKGYSKLDLGHVEICAHIENNGVKKFYGIGNNGSFATDSYGYGSIDILSFGVAYRAPSTNQ